MEQTKTEKRGGKRPNSGPKKKLDKEEYKRVSITIHKSLIKKLKELIKKFKNENNR